MHNDASSSTPTRLVGVSGLSRRGAVGDGRGLGRSGSSETLDFEVLEQLEDGLGFVEVVIHYQGLVDAHSQPHRITYQC